MVHAPFISRRGKQAQRKHLRVSSFGPLLVDKWGEELPPF